MNVLKLEVEVKHRKSGFSTKFTGAISEKMVEILDDEDKTKIQNNLDEICQVVSGAITRDIEESMDDLDEFEKFLKEKKDEILGSMTKEEKRQMKEIEKELESFPSDEEKASFIKAKILEELERLLD